MPQEYIQQQTIRGTVPKTGILLAHLDFEGIIQGTQAGTGTTYEIRHNVTTPFEGSACLEMRTKTATPAINDYAQITLHFPVKSSRFITMEVHLRSSLIGSRDLYTLLFTYDNGVNQKNWGIRLTGATGVWAYRDSAGTYTNFLTLDKVLKANTWHWIHLSYDTTNNQYRRFKTANQDVDMSTLSGQSSATGDEITGEFNLFIHASTAAQASVLYDNIIITEE